MSCVNFVYSLSNFLMSGLFPLALSWISKVLVKDVAVWRSEDNKSRKSTLSLWVPIFTSTEREIDRQQQQQRQEQAEPTGCRERKRARGDTLDQSASLLRRILPRLTSLHLRIWFAELRQVRVDIDCHHLLVAPPTEQRRATEANARQQASQSDAHICLPAAPPCPCH
jgi:hypothetical protein